MALLCRAATQRACCGRGQVRWSHCESRAQAPTANVTSVHSRVRSTVEHARPVGDVRRSTLRLWQRSQRSSSPQTFSTPSRCTTLHSSQHTTRSALPYSSRASAKLNSVHRSQMRVARAVWVCPQTWAGEGKRGIWLQVPLAAVHLVEPAVRQGFVPHHAGALTHTHTHTHGGACRPICIAFGRRMGMTRYCVSVCVCVCV